MYLEPPQPAAEPDVDPRAVRRKVMWRILPLIFILYVIAYLDRANLGNAWLQMKYLPGFGPEVLGWGAGIFFAGYQLLEIPGALLVERWSARKWFARILVTWGVCSMGMALVTTPWQFYLARFLLGLAEAGFFPGLVIYFTHWFPRADRGRALASMVLAVPVSLTVGTWISGALLSVGWFGLAGWQWLFLVEGAPAVLMGVAVPFLLTDRPAQARWLTADERAWLVETLAEDRRQAKQAGGETLSQALRRPTVWLLALGIFAANTGGYALVFWLPTVVNTLLKEAVGAAAPTNEAVLGWTGLVYFCGLAGVWLSGQSSDRTGERKWHCAAGMALTGVFLAASVVPGQPWALVFVWLCLAGFFAFTWPSPFWVLPTLTLSDSAAAVAIGLINMSANFAGLVGSPIVGSMKKFGASDPMCLLFLACCYLAGGAVIALFRIPRHSNQG
jgi:ACS family tartrate transporter-like MFS transporter